MAEQPIIAASLLSGRMQDNIEDTFRTIGLSMFPDRQDDLQTDCSCHDWSNSCKHAAAVYLLLGEEFDRDPFLIFRMRGMDWEDLLGPEFRHSALTLGGPALPAEPLPAQPGDFWSNPPTALRDKDHAGSTVVLHMAGALPWQLGRFPLRRGKPRISPGPAGHPPRRLASCHRVPHGAGETARQTRARSKRRNRHGPQSLIACAKVYAKV